MGKGVTTLFVGLLLFGLSASVDAQRAGRRVATLALLAENPGFFHAEDVIIRADVVGENVLAYLVDDETRLLVLDVVPPPSGVRDRLEVVGTFYDVGRLQPHDPRMAGLPIERLSDSLLNKAWPGVGELPLIVASSSMPFEGAPAATLRTIALDPKAYVGEGVTLTGRFRGRNLYGDLPGSPGESRHDFVLASADAAVWIVGMEPKGEDFEFDVRGRIDTGRWLEVTGTVRVRGGMVIVDAGSIRLADPITDPPAPARAALRQGPPPEVIFSTPLEGETEISTDAPVRIQFSRDMDADSFEGRVNVSYPNTPGRAAATAPTTGERPALEMSYRGSNRVLEVHTAGPFEPYSTLTVSLLGGITAADGAPLAPWSLTFSTGR